MDVTSRNAEWPIEHKICRSDRAAGYRECGENGSDNDPCKT